MQEDYEESHRPCASHAALICSGDLPSMPAGSMAAPPAYGWTALSDAFLGNPGDLYRFLLGLLRIPVSSAPRVCGNPEVHPSALLLLMRFRAGTLGLLTVTFVLFVIHPRFLSALDWVGLSADRPDCLDVPSCVQARWLPPLSRPGLWRVSASVSRHVCRSSF